MNAVTKCPPTVRFNAVLGKQACHINPRSSVKNLTVVPEPQAIPACGDDPQEFAQAFLNEMLDFDRF